MKLFHRGGKLVDEQEEEIEALFGADGTGRRVDRAARRTPTRPISRTSSSAFGSDLSGCGSASTARTARSRSSRRARSRSSAPRCTRSAREPDGSNINVGCGATDLRALQQLVTSEGLDLGVAFDGDGDRMLAVDERGRVGRRRSDPRGARAPSRRRPRRGHGDDEPRLPRLMAEHGIKVVTTPVGDRYVLEALKREGGLLGGEQSGHLIWLGNHVTGDGLAAALLLCGALRGRTLSEAVAVMPRYPQVMRNIARCPSGASRRGAHARSTGSTPSSARAAACSCGRRVRSRSSASWPRRKMRKMQRSCVLASPRSWKESSAEPDGGRRRALSRLMRRPHVRNHRIRRIA